MECLVANSPRAEHLHYLVDGFNIRLALCFQESVGFRIIAGSHLVKGQSRKSLGCSVAHPAIFLGLVWEIPHDLAQRRTVDQQLHSIRTRRHIGRGLAINSGKIVGIGCQDLAILECVKYLNGVVGAGAHQLRWPISLD